VGEDGKIMQELITVIIPAHNAAATLDQTLESVRSQSYRDIEILAVDDGSGDETPSIVMRHAAADDRVRLISQANGGVAAARNRGIAEARGKLIAPIDADDLWASTKLEKQIATMAEGGPGVGLVYCWYAIIDAEGFIKGIAKPTTSGKVLSCLCANNFVGNASSPLMRKDVMLAAGAYSTQLRAVRAQGCEDWLLYLRIAEKHEFRVVEECLLGYRMVPGSMSRDGRQMLRSVRHVSGQILERNPDQSQNLVNGDFNLSAWLFRRAMSGLRLCTAAYIAAIISLKHPKRFALSFIPEMVQRSFAALIRLVLQAPKNRFAIGGTGESQVQTTCLRCTNGA
jgi:glycosyltransferase involved in cell wall biosynthesis